MADDTTQMKPQDTVIYLLGQLQGGVDSLHASVNASNVSQAAVNKANEEEHAKFRETLGAHATELAIIRDQGQTKTASRMTRVQHWTLLLGIPGGVATVIGLITLIHH
jgi:hypothetical protein